MRLQTILASVAAGLLGGMDWRTVAETEGAAAVEAELAARLRSKVEPVSKISSQMTAEGWSWEAASDPAFLAKQKVQLTAGEEVLGPGFVIARDICYSLSREAGLPGGAIRDAVRDELDNAVFAAIVVPRDPSIADWVQLTADAWCQVVSREAVAGLLAQV